MENIKISKKNSQKKIKDFLLEFANGELTSSKINKLIENGDIKVNKKRIVWNYILKENDIINIYKKIKKSNRDFLKAKSELKVVYEDENIIIVNKPRGLICQIDSKEKYDTLNNRIKKYLYSNNDESYFNANLVHRLDKYTFGLCVAGKKTDVIRILNDLWNTNQINKYYDCLVLGVLKNKKGRLINYIKENEDKKIMKIDKDNQYNKKIITNYVVKKEFKNFSNLEINIETGKKHQIRVHMASIGHPILGDTKYNKENNLNYKYPCLCSKKIVFNIDENCHLNYLNNKSFILKDIKYK